MRPTYIRLPILMFLLAAPVLLRAQTSDTTNPEIREDLNANPATEVRSLEMYQAAVTAMLREEKFDDLDSLANSAIYSKARIAGGVWKLRMISDGIACPLAPSADDNAWNTHLERLKRWVAIKPDSITARVGLAEAYLCYATKARGQGWAPTVPEEGLKLYGERRHIALSILKKASTLMAKSPEWYVAMQRATFGESTRTRSDALLEQAIAFEPLYYTFYRTHAIALLPKWDGRDGEVESFADTIRARIGGDEGNIIYYEIAAELVRQSCLCSGKDDEPLARMNWPKIVLGYNALEHRYGLTLYKMNQFAQIAVVAGHAEIAVPLFDTLVNNWDAGTWETYIKFLGARDLAYFSVDTTERLKPAIAAVRANLQTQEGPQYNEMAAREFRTAAAAIVKASMQEASKDRRKFELFVLVSEEGKVLRLLPSPTTGVGYSLATRVMQMQEITLPTPPKPQYWIKLAIDPRTASPTP